MRPIEQIISEVQAEERARRDGDIARHHRANEKLQAVFRVLNEGGQVRKAYDALADHDQNGVDILVRRFGKTVCNVFKDPDHEGGDIRIEIHTAGGPPDEEWYADPEHATRRVIELLTKHKARWPTRDRLEGVRSFDEENRWKM
jgi:hypothetical protein